VRIDNGRHPIQWHFDFHLLMTVEQHSAIKYYDIWLINLNYVQRTAAVHCLRGGKEVAELCTSYARFI